MYGIKAFLLFLMFLLIAGVFTLGLVRDWRTKREIGGGTLKRIGSTAFVIVWFLGISSVYARKAFFLHELSTIQSNDVSSIQIGQHDFADPVIVAELIGSLHHSRWFEVNHGGWGNSIPMTIRRKSAPNLVIDVALYFREPAAIVGPANPQGLGYSPTQFFNAELPAVLERHGVMLPNCDSAHGRPCTSEQLNP